MLRYFSLPFFSPLFKTHQKIFGVAAKLTYFSFNCFILLREADLAIVLTRMFCGKINQTNHLKLSLGAFCIATLL